MQFYRVVVGSLWDSQDKLVESPTESYLCVKEGDAQNMGLFLGTPRSAPTDGYCRYK